MLVIALLLVLCSVEVLQTTSWSAFRHAHQLAKLQRQYRRGTSFSAATSTVEVANDTKGITAEGSTTNAKGGKVYIPKAAGEWSKTQPTSPKPSYSSNQGYSKQGNSNNLPYKSGTSYKPQYNNGKQQGGYSRPFTPPANGAPALILNEKPLLLIACKFPKVMSDEKKRLLELQPQFKQEDSANRRSRPNNYNNNGGGGMMNRNNDRLTRQDIQMLSNVIVPVKPNVKDKGKKTKQQIDDERKARLAKKPAKDSKEGKEVLDDDDDDDEAGFADAYGDEEDYYEDNEEDAKSINELSPFILVKLEDEGYSIEDMRTTLYAMYNVKASLSQIARKLDEDKNGKNLTKQRYSKTGKTRRDRYKARQAKFAPKVDDRILLPLNDEIPLKELAGLMEVGGGELIKYLMLNEGMMVTLNQNIPREMAIKILDVFKKEWKDDDSDETLELIEDKVQSSKIPSKIISRPPVVTIMGHVDHGKTSLLDRIRDSKVAAKEAGGITQSISAFNVMTSSDRAVTFIDTPGHAAFSAMRKRGATVTDIVVLVIAADDGVMEQTKECMDAARLANCPIVIAINKIDKPGADVEKVKISLVNYGIMIEEYGGDVQCIPVSAKSGDGIQDLLDSILVQADVMNLTTDVNAPVTGSIVEASIDKGLGVVATTLLQAGTVKVGDHVVVGSSWGKVRLLLNDQGKSISEATASIPVRLVGLDKVPSAGDKIIIAKSDEEAREMAEAMQRYNKQQAGSANTASLFANAAILKGGEIDTREQIKVPIILKTDVDGSAEAIKAALESIIAENTNTVSKVDIVLSQVGGVTTSDVSIAAAAKGSVIAFNVAATVQAMDDARSNNVEIKYYNVLYDLLDDMTEKVKATIAPVMNGELVGTASIKKVFKIGKVGKVAGCEITTGKMLKQSQVRILREGKTQVYLGPISSLKYFKDEVGEVLAGKECGISFDNFQDLQENDVIECYVTATKPDSKKKDQNDQ